MKDFIGIYLLGVAIVFVLFFLYETRQYFKGKDIEISAVLGAIFLSLCSWTIVFVALFAACLSILEKLGLDGVVVIKGKKKSNGQQG